MTEFKQHSNIALQLLVKSQQGNLGVDVKELMAFQLTPVPYSLGTADEIHDKDRQKFKLSLPEQESSSC